MRNLFPFFQHHPSLAYLDSAATSLKLGAALDMTRLYDETLSTNAARGLYPLAEVTSQKLDAVRQITANFVGGKKEEIIFTSGTTNGINMLTESLLLSSLPETGSIVVAVDNHHSHFLPWKRLAERKNYSFLVAPTNKEGFIDTEELTNLVSSTTKVVAISAVSNVYGVKNDIPSLVKKIREKNPTTFIVIDAAQAAPHMPLIATAWDIDALVFSGHKTYAPTGVGVLWLRKKWQNTLSPAFLGGGMVLDVVKPLWKEGPEKFEAGTLPLGSIMGLGTALDWLQKNQQSITLQEEELLAYAFQKLESGFGNMITILGSKNPKEKVGLISFTLEGVHPHDIASLLGENGICVRAGEHCASPLHQALSLPATTRISFGPYTREEDISTLVEKLKEIIVLFQK